MNEKKNIWQSTGYFQRPEVMCNYFEKKTTDSSAFIGYAPDGNMFYWSITDMYLDIFGELSPLGTLSLCLDAGKDLPQDRESGLISFQQKSIEVAADILNFDFNSLQNGLNGYHIAAAVFGKTILYQEGPFYRAENIIVVPGYAGKGLIVQMLDFIADQIKIPVYSGNLQRSGVDVIIKTTSVNS